MSKQAENDNEVITKAYVDQFSQENERSRRDVGLDYYDEPNHLVKNNQTIAFNNNFTTNVRSIKINDIPTNDNDVIRKKYIDDELDKKTILRFNQTLENYLKVSVGYYQIDSAEMIHYKNSNNKSYRYIFIIIDNFSKCFWATPPKNEK